MYQLAQTRNMSVLVIVLLRSEGVLLAAIGLLPYVVLAERISREQSLGIFHQSGRVVVVV